MSSTDPGPAPETTKNDDDGGGFTLPSVLSSFASNPRAFVVGAVLSTILEGVFGALSALLGAVILLFGGSQPTASPADEATVGIADIPFIALRALRGVGGGVAAAIDGTVASLAGILATLPAPVAAFAVPAAGVGVLVVFVVAGSRLVDVALDILPGGGGL
jgi:hypothetical protein